MDSKKEKRMDAGYMGMISEDHSAVANLPQNVVQKAYPKCDYLSYHLDDSISGINSQIDDSVRRSSSHKSKSMY